MTDTTLTTRRRGRTPDLGIATFLRLRRQRQALARLDSHMLRDIGIDAGAAASEAHRPIWDVPQAWRR